MKKMKQNVTFSSEWKKDNDCYIIKYENKGVETGRVYKGAVSDALISKENAGCEIQNAHALRKENKDNIKICSVSVVGKTDGQNSSMGKSDRNPSCQTGNGNDRIRNEKYGSSPGDA